MSRTAKKKPVAKKTKTPKKRSPQDATMRNVKASNKRTSELAAELRKVLDAIGNVALMVDGQGNRIAALEQEVEGRMPATIAKAIAEVTERVDALDTKVRGLDQRTTSMIRLGAPLE